MPNSDRLFRDHPESGHFALPTPLYQCVKNSLFSRLFSSLRLLPYQGALSTWSVTPVSPLHVPKRKCRYPLSSLARGPTVPIKLRTEVSCLLTSYQDKEPPLRLLFFSILGSALLGLLAHPYAMRHGTANPSLTFQVINCPSMQPFSYFFQHA